MKKLYVGNLAYATTEDSLTSFFEAYSPIASVKIITDHMTGRSRGFGFVELDDNDRADAAIAELNGKSLDGKNLTINEARPQVRTGGGGGYGDRGGRGGGYGDRGGHGGDRGGRGGGRNWR